MQLEQEDEDDYEQTCVGGDMASEFDEYPVDDDELKITRAG
jgi:hypothetical protein